VQQALTLQVNQAPPPIANDENKDLKRERNYPDQPPTIPHSIRGYQIDKNGNKCLTCHSRANSARTQATMISITHYMDRDGQPYELIAEGLLAVCIQHECDHLNGKLFVDYLSNLKRDRIKKKLEKLHRQNA